MQTAEEWLNYKSNDFPYYGVSLHKIRKIQLDAYLEGIIDALNIKDEQLQAKVNNLKLQIEKDKKFLERK